MAGQEPQTNKRDEQEDAWLSAITFNWTNVDLTSPVVVSCSCPCRLSSVARVACVPGCLSWPHHSVPCGTRYSLYGLHHRESHVDAEHGMIRSLVGCSTNAIITIAENFNAQLLVLLHKREWDRTHRYTWVSERDRLCVCFITKRANRTVNGVFFQTGRKGKLNLGNSLG